MSALGHRGHGGVPSKGRGRLAAVACLFLLVAFAGAVAQERRLRFDHVAAVGDIDVRALQEDAAGFVWIGSSEGLARFDGHRLEAVGGQALGVVNGLAKSGGDFLWIASETGVWRRDMRSEELLRVDCPGVDNPRFDQLQAKGSSVRALGRSGSFHIYAATLACKRLEIAGLPANQPVERFLDDASGTWLAVRDRGLWRCEDSCERVAAWAPALSHTRVRWISATGDGGLHVGTHRHGLYRLNADGSVAAHWWRGDDAPAGHALTTNGVMALARSPDEGLFVGLWAGGLIQIGRDGEVLARPKPLPNDDSSLRGANLHAVMLARNGTLWLGHEHGLDILDPIRNQTRWIGRAAEGVDGLARSSVHSLLYLHGRLLAGTKGGGLAVIDSATGLVTTLSQEPGRADSLPDDTIWSIAPAVDGTLMLGTSGGVARIEAASLRVQRLASTPDLPSDDVVAIVPARDGGHWAATWAGGVVKLDRAGRVERKWGADDGLRVATMSALFQASDGRVLAGNTEGLYQLGVNGRFRPVAIDGSKRAARGNAVDAIAQDAGGTLWIGSSNGGLARWPPGEANPRWSNDAELSTLAVLDIEPGEGGSLWLGTDQGLLELDGSGKVLRRMGREAGFDFGLVAAIATAEPGVLWIGGTNGVHRVMPASMRERAAIGAPVISGVRLFNRPLRPGDGQALSATPTSGGSLDLRYDQDMLTLDFALTGLPQPVGTRFRYRLQGFDRDWVEASADEAHAVYTRLPPGQYRFLVESGDASGWSGRVAELPMRVRPPWWLAWWAKAGAILLALGAIGLWYRMRTMQLRLQSQRLERTVAERTSELRVANEALRTAARTDVLTRLANRYGFREDIAPRWGRHPGDAFLFLADIDHFKSINDRCGHDVGDAVLVLVARRLQSTALETDLVARWGGEEFLCLLEGGDVPARAEAIRKAVASARPPGLPADIAISMTAGLTRVGGGEDFASAIRRADSLLYEGKRSGRDRLVVDG